MTHLLEAKEITKIFGEKEQATRALDRVSLTVQSGDFITVMGPSGSGKSTLLFALSGMDTIDEGSLTFKGKNLLDMKEEEMADIRRQNMGFVFQDATMLANLDILDNILLPSYEDHQDNKEEWIQHAKDYMSRVGIGGLENRQITEVSGGQLQRASICRGILHQPDILFGDEPTGALNSQVSKEIMDLFEDLNQEGMTIFLVTHDAQVAARAKRVLFMKDGQVEEELHLESDDFDKKLLAVNKKMTQLGI